MDIPNIGTTETRIDFADMMRALKDHQTEVLGVVTKLIEEANEFKFRGQTIGYMSRQLSELEQIHAENLGALQNRLLDQYEYSADRRYGSSRLKRIATLGGSGRNDADLAAEGAFAEMESLRDAIEQMNQRQIVAALMTRLRLLEHLAGSREGGIELAMELLQAVLPGRDYRRIVAMALEAGSANEE